MSLQKYMGYFMHLPVYRSRDLHLTKN